MNRGYLSNFLRKLHLIAFTDRVNYCIQQLKNLSENREFKKNNPGVLLPPDYLIYESHKINYRSFYSDSIGSAEWLTGLIKRYSSVDGVRILDWGCGPGRIIRHLPLFIGNSCELTGTDYNERSIKWCRENLKGINFTINGSDALLPFPDNYFDIIYGLSVFTHLPVEKHNEWKDELARILKQGGIILFTTQGENFITNLTATELKKFKLGEPAVRGNSAPGHRTFSTFQPAQFVKRLFEGMQLLDHIVYEAAYGVVPPQDVWIFRK